MNKTATDYLNALSDTLITNAKQIGITRHVVGSIIFQNSKILLLRRKPEDFMGDLYELPGGQVELGESLSLALKRELYEETGLNLSSIEKYIGFFDYYSKNNIASRQFNFLVKVIPPLDIKLAEHINFIWMDYEKLDTINITDKQKRFF